MIYSYYHIMSILNQYNQPSLTNFEKTQILMQVKRSIKWSDELITPNDIFSVAWLGDCEIIDVINHNIKDDVRTEKWINAFNYIFFKWLHAYIQTIWRLRKYKINLSDFEEFTTSEDIINFLRVTEEESKKARIHCAITRFSRAADNVLNAPTLHMLEVKENEILWLLKEPLYLENVWDDYVWHYGWWKGKIIFVLSSRSKSVLSSTRKWVHDPKYDKAEDIKDWVWMTFKTETWAKAVKLMSYVDSILCESNLLVKWKWKKIPDILNSISWNLPIDFLSKLEDINMTTKSGTAEWYIDIKLVWFVWSVPIEIKFSVLSSENENWINFQPIYKSLKWTIEWELIRSMNWYATLDDLKDVASNLIENIQQDLNESPIRRGTDVETYYREIWKDLKKLWFIETEMKWAYIKTLKWKKSYLKTWLKNYFISKLIKKKLKTWKIVYVNTRAENLSNAEFYPEFLDVKN